MFIDADKEGYPGYLDWAADNLRPGGVVLLDNAFLFGDLPEPADGRPRQRRSAPCSPSTRSLARSGSFRATVLPTGEGLAFGVRIDLGAAPHPNARATLGSPLREGEGIRTSP